jgi:hypothetical protein
MNPWWFLQIQRVKWSGYKHKLDRTPGVCSMHSRSLCTGHMRSLLAALVVWCGFPSPTCAADDYLSILEAEADNTGNVSDVTAEDVSLNRPEKTGVGGSKLITPGLSFAEFEAVLDSQYSGSHQLYIRLSKGDREKVYHAYQDDNRISSVREEIVRLLSAG